MPPPDAAARFERQVAAVARRRLAADLLTAAAIGALAFAVMRGVLLLAGSGRILPPLSIAAASAAAAVVVAWRRWDRVRAARLLEQAAPASHNVIVTAEELLRTGRGAPAVVRRVVRDALAAAERVPLDAAAPVSGRMIGAVAAIMVAALAAAAGPRAPVPARDDHGIGEGGDTAPAAVSLTVTIVPPAYLGLPERQLDNPVRIEAIASSRVRVALAAASGWRVRFGATQLAVTVAGDRATAEVVASESGYLAIEAADRAAGGPRLIPLVVSQDQAPAIEIEAPGTDLLVPAADASIPVTAIATDDHGLRTLELRYTTVSGSGEQYEFEEGRLALQIDRASVRRWTAKATLALQVLKLRPGDALVYRVVGSDARPADAGLATSETYVVEVAGPGPATLAGFELPPDRERHALSQQMILLKLQRLRARERAMTREAVAEASASIAAEQRAVRANFIFLTGGHVEDEAEEAAHSHEIQEGRLAHRARKDIDEAVAQMSRVEQALAEVNPGEAIPPARAAVEALQRAFGRSRYLLRSLPVRSRLDPTRRLSGDRSEARDSSRTVEAAEGDRAAAAARAILGALGAIASRDPLPSDATQLSALAERALAVDPASSEWQAIAAALSAAAGAARGAGESREVRHQLGAALFRLQQEASRGAVPGKAADPRDRALLGAWAAGGGSR